MAQTIQITRRCQQRGQSPGQSFDVVNPFEHVAERLPSRLSQGEPLDRIVALTNHGQVEQRL